MTEVRNFVYLASYNHRFIKKFAFIATYLTRLIHIEVPFVWSDKCEESFKNLKSLLTTTIIALPIEVKDFIVLCIASLSSLCVAIMQYRNVICYVSR